MGALVLMMRMEKRSDVKISLFDVSHARTRSQLAVLIAGRERHAERFEVKEPGEIDMVSRALVLRAGDRDLPTLLACLAALRPGHAVAFLPASDEILSACQPELVAPAPGSGTGLAGNTAAVVSVLGITAAGRAPARLGIWPARCPNCPAGQR